MKYYRYTLIDVASFLPVWKEPAKSGPFFPEGIEFIFSVEDSSARGIPVFYGSLKESYEPDEWMEEVTEEDLILLFRSELKTRLSIEKDRLLSNSEFQYDGTYYGVTESVHTGLNCIVDTMNMDTSILAVDFKIGTSWLKLDLIEAKRILTYINKYIQGVYSWCYESHKAIDGCKSIQELLNLNFSKS